MSFKDSWEKFLARALSWFPTTEVADSRIPDSYYKDLIGMYRSRARFWRSVSLCNLGVTGLIVLVGIFVFWTGAPVSDVKSESEVRLLTELTGKRKELSSLASQEAQMIANHEIASRASKLAMILGGCYDSVDAFVLDPIPENSRLLNPSLDSGIRILSAVVEASRTDSIDKVDRKETYTTDDVSIAIPSSILPGGDIRFPVQSLQTISIELKSLGYEGKELLSILQGIQVAFASPPDSWENSTQLTQLRKQFNVAPFAAIKIVQEKLEQDTKNLTRDYERWLRSSPARERVRVETERAMDDIQEQLKTARADREKILFMSWIPDLTLRAGAVVLLLFLTQILLSAYRYTLSLSAFYLSRADAIQLLQPRSESEFWYDIDELKTLVDYFSPSSIAIDSVQSPTEQVTSLAKSWVERGAGA